MGQGTEKGDSVSGTTATRRVAGVGGSCLVM